MPHSHTWDAAVRYTHRPWRVAAYLKEDLHLSLHYYRFVHHEMSNKTCARNSLHRHSNVENTFSHVYISDKYSHGMSNSWGLV